MGFPDSDQPTDRREPSGDAEYQREIGQGRSSRRPVRTLGYVLARRETARGRRIRWPIVGGIVVIVALVAVLAIYLVPKYQRQADTQKFTPTAAHNDPSIDIPCVVHRDYPAGLHIGPTQRVAYDTSPPMGGPHGASWATRTGVVYSKAIRAENAVHSLEHGGIWIAYNPDSVTGAALDSPGVTS